MATTPTVEAKVPPAPHKWGELLADARVVENLKAPKTIDDIDASIRAFADRAFAEGKALRVVVSSSTVAAELERAVRLYTKLTGRVCRLSRHTTQTDGGVPVHVVVKAAPPAKPAEAA
jgi:hypothetical protein